MHLIAVILCFNQGGKTMNYKSLNQAKESIEKLDTNIKCILGLLEIVHLGMLEMYQCNDDTANFELAFLHTLKNSLNSLCENDIIELQSYIDQLEQS